MYNEIGGCGGVLPWENVNFQNLRNAIFGLLAGTEVWIITDTVTTKLKGNFFLVTPLYTPYFLAAPPPLKPYFLAWSPSNPTSPPYFIKNERSLNSQRKTGPLFSKYGHKTILSTSKNFRIMILSFFRLLLNSGEK